MNQGALINIQDADGDTALHVSESAESTQLLLSYGADPQLCNSLGYLPIEIAYREGREDVVAVLTPYTPEYRKLENDDVERDINLEDLENEAIDVYEIARMHGINLEIINEEGTEEEKVLDR